MSNEDLLKRLRAVNIDEEFDLWNNSHLLAEAADAIEHCHASHEAMTQEIERLTRERDEAREDASVARQSLYEVCEQRNSAMAINAALSAFDLKVMAERDAAERKVEKLRGLLKEILEFVDDPYDEIAIYIGNALAETEKGDD